MALRYSWEELTDLLYRRYHEPAAVLAMDMEAGMSLLEYAMEQEADRMIFARWIQGAQYSQSFEQFKAALRPPEMKPTEVVLEDVGNILQAFEQER